MQIFQSLQHIWLYLRDDIIYMKKPISEQIITDAPEFLTFGVFLLLMHEANKSFLSASRTMIIL